MNDYNERLTSNLISALSAMTAAFIGTFIGMLMMWALAHDALDIAYDAAETSQDAAERAEQAEYELGRTQEQYERDMAGLVNDLWTCQDRNLDLKVHCPLYVAP